MAREEPQVLLDEIIKAVRSNSSLDIPFQDEKGREWRLLLNRVHP